MGATVRQARDDDAVRILFPETPRHVDEAAVVRAETDDWPTFVTAADLTGGDGSPPK